MAFSRALCPVQTGKHWLLPWPSAVPCAQYRLVSTGYCHGPQPCPVPSTDWDWKALVIALDFSRALCPVQTGEHWLLPWPSTVPCAQYRLVSTGYCHGLRPCPVPSTDWDWFFRVPCAQYRLVSTGYHLAFSHALCPCAQYRLVSTGYCHVLQLCPVPSTDWDW
ncbi:hypothetical protein NDU88_007413 [Pleurodeles waltl]|uniref:Uncharacterized protein n=1 Tax=Pleurodeles waltl TaxID=8319 RepID=A0AAV7WG34_PLEWA|nr:hypothetical protein NDU88_007413 [Pleurodeles waltl]